MKRKLLCILITVFSLVTVSDAFAGDGIETLIKALSHGISSIIVPDGQSTEADDLMMSQEKKRSSADMPFTMAGTSAVERYFPMCNGDNKDYEFFYQGTTYTPTLTYTQVQYQGRTCFQEGNANNNAEVYYGYSGNSLVMYGAIIEGVDYSFNSPLTVLTDNSVNNGGSEQSSTTVTDPDYGNITVNATVSVGKIGAVTIPLGTVADCRSVDMSVTIVIPGGSQTMEFLEDAWVLAPEIGKLKVAACTPSGDRVGDFVITGGIVCGRDVVEIITPPATASFTATPLEGLTPLGVQFTDQSEGSVNSWLWNFGDGSTSGQQNPVHSYSDPGIFTVSLRVSGPSNSDTEQKADYIRVIHAGADLNNDNNVDLADAILALQIIIDNPVSLGPGQHPGVTGKGQVGLEEAIYILQVVSNLR